MKYSFLIILCISFYGAHAQKARINNVDSIYYFVDTVNTPIKQRMMDIGVESTVQYFTIMCPCLQYNANPTFVYTVKDPGQIIDKTTFDRLNTVSIVKLIDLAKQTTDLSATILYVYFFVEKNNDDKYIIHKTRLLPPRRSNISRNYEKITN